MTLPPKLVIFDCDGVVVDSEGPTLLLLRDSLAAHGLDRTVEQITDQFIGGTMSGNMAKARDMGADLPDNWVDAFYSELYAELAKSVVAIPGIEVVLDALDAAGIPYAIGSNGRTEKMNVTLTRTGLINRFAGRAYSAQSSGRPKPYPDIYLKIAKDMNVAPHQSVVIEDSPTGARAAVAAEMKCFGFTHETPSEKLAPIADVLFENMLDLPGLLGLAS
ncbi:MAG: HAD-IA family hydrolase [Pseudoruegeria sp.]